MIIYHVEGFDEDYMLQCSFVTISLRSALEMAKKMYKEQNVETVFLNYWKDDLLIMVEAIDENGNFKY